MASIYVSDVMDLVALTLELQQWTEPYGPPELAYRDTFTWDGIGEDSPQRWLARALFLAAASMSNAPGEGSPGAPQLGAPHTLYETGDSQI